ncbi:hypothetical protein [Intestinibacter sp.]|uniref:hypothetical protein n=1 Tax=Intestinibacter sp. TaxID=1965304 RepID=UPI003F1905A6
MLQKATAAFCKCNCIGTLSNNIFGGDKSTPSSSGTDGYSYPKDILDISFLFHDSNVTYKFENANIFKHLTKL